MLRHFRETDAFELTIVFGTFIICSQSVLNLDRKKIDWVNKTLQEVKGKSIEDEAKINDAQRLNAKTETDVVKV